MNDDLDRSGKFHIRQKDGLFYAQVHCPECGSTFGSGEYLPSIGRAVAEARQGLVEHMAKYHKESQR